MDNQDANVPENADKLLFAEDLVSYALTHVFRQPYEGARAAPYRAFIRSAFNESVKTAISYLIPRLQAHNTPYYDRIDAVNDPNERDFLVVVADIQDCYASKGLDATRFLLFCSDLTIVASIFRKNGVEVAPDISVSAVVEVLRDYDMLSTGWGTLHVLSSKLEQLCKDSRDLLTPDTSSPSTPDSPRQEQDLLVILEGKDSPPQSKDDNEIPVGDKKDEFRVNVADSKDEFVVNKNIHTENVESQCLSTQKELLQPSGVSQVVRQDEKKSTMKGEDKMHITDSKDRLFVNDGIEGEKLHGSSISGEDKTSQNVNTFHGVPEKLGTTASCSKRETEKRFLDGKGPSISIEEINFATHRNSLVLKEDCKVQLLDTSDEQKKLELSEDNCKLVKLQKDSEAHRSHQLPGPSSESTFRDKAMIFSNLFPVGSTSSAKSPGEKRSSVLPSKQNTEKKLKQ